jgi:membrane fusion protein (multidrug efflux system)
MSTQAVASQPPASLAREVVAPSKPAKAVMRKRALFLGAALLIGAASVWYGQQWWTVGRFIESTDDAFVGGDVVVLAPKVAGFIAEVAVTDNQAVRAGDLLIRLDDRDFRAALAKAEAAVAGANAALANLAANRRLQQSVIAQAQADLPATAAEIVRARFDVDRYRTLAQDHAAPLQQFQQADAAYSKALAADQRAHAALDAATRELDVIDTRTQQAQATLAGAIADRDTARLNLGYTELRAPVDGTVGNRSAHVGAYATVGAQILSLVPARGLWVDANFKESQLAGMHAGQTVTVLADVLPGRVFHGHVASLAPATGAQFSVLPAENATGNFTKIVQRVPVRVTLDGDGSLLGALRPGLSVTASVDLRDTVP